MLIAMVKADGKFFTATKEVKVTIGGCAASAQSGHRSQDMAETHEDPRQDGSDPADVKVLDEPSDGNRAAKKYKGDLVPVHVIQIVTAHPQWQDCFRRTMESGHSTRNPFLGFRVKARRRATRLRQLDDTTGDKGSIDTTVAAA
jgi:hypothetical protein